MFYSGDKLIATDPYQMEDGECCLTVGKPYQIDLVHYRDLSFSISGDDGGEIVIGFEEAKGIFDLENIISDEDE
jgi:hypothetical protein